MTGFRIDEFDFTGPALASEASREPRLSNWPVVYLLDDGRRIYTGESLNLASRFRHHLDAPDKASLIVARVILDPTFNKSACLDLESFLIRLLAGDGTREVLNRNDGITNADYYGREGYQAIFDEIFDALRARGVFSRSVRQIENTDLFKLSPFKALSSDQEIAVEDILEGLFEDVESGVGSRIVIQGDPGTGKTVVAIFLMKLLSDIQSADSSSPLDSDTLLSEYFVGGYPELLADFRVGLVVPQQSLRRSIQKVFAKTPGLDPSMVLTPFQVGQAEVKFDLLIVDEAHRLNQRSSQASGQQNLLFRTINEHLFGTDDLATTQIDWIEAQSNHQIYLIDVAQAVRPHDVGSEVLNGLIDDVSNHGRRYPLMGQMRVRAGEDYVGYVRGLLSDDLPPASEFAEYDLRFFDSFRSMRDELRKRNAEHGLCRMVAGYAWPWRSKNDKSAVDVSIEGIDMQWNTKAVDWVNSPGAVDEMGSIHTIQGYDLNFAGVVIGPDLRWDEARKRVVFDRANYFDSRGVQNNSMRGIVYSDEDILRFVRNIYGVLLTRGMLGTYVYVHDVALRDRLRPMFRACVTETAECERDST